MSAIGKGEGSKIGQNCQRIVLKNFQHGGGGCQKSGKIVDVVYGWSLGVKIAWGLSNQNVGN